MDALPIKEGIPVSAIEALEHLMPGHDISYRVARRVAGMGSLGHARFIAIAEWHGGQIAREAKALVPSACHWVQGGKGPAEILYQTIFSGAVRCPDPFVQLRGRWIVRRLAPHGSRIELVTLLARGTELRLLHAMGWETANIPMGTKSARKGILRHLGRQKGNWLHKAGGEMVKAVRADWQTWRKEGYA